MESERASTADIAVARANVETAQATADHAQADLNRMKTLVDKEEISRLEYDSYASSTRVALSQLQAAKDKLASVTKDAETKKAALLSAQARIAQAQAGILQAKATQRQVPVRVADASSAAASIAQAHANLEAAKLDLSYTTIVAPMDGVVTRKSVEVGQVVQQGQGLLMLVPLQDVWVTANFKETQLADVRNGQKAEVKADLSGKTYPGHVDSLAAATGTRMSLLPPGERHRQLRQGGSKNSGEDRAGSDSRRQSSAASGNEYRSDHFHQVARPQLESHYAELLYKPK